MNKKLQKQPIARYNRIAEIMEVKQITQEVLAYDTGITQRSISLYKTGKREPSLETLAKISKALKVAGKDLINF
jgi:transcriptional regulator with XRE-family HTH domain